ncbi:triose-phosphate isomerase [Leptobacterium flavescens]|uniref:Triosephosphate isomerase n=1 Tax=Leptobacterium flavescens TaxID=472055 RepID=A0A6P0UX97_9FLAO|nr:triose-phosphate isomerase [Leptobacterium flavescens]NER15323.1 triose-phosphate isomerase [Leptobacterium flavescens]
MRKKIVAGNWKMNNDLSRTQSLIKELKERENSTEVKVMIAPAFTNLESAGKELENSSIEVVAQNMHFAENGAYTGEVSAEMLKSIGIQTVILGHSERRAYFGEDDALLAKKVDAALKNGMKVIFCFGEELEDRNSGDHFMVVESQLKNALFHLDADNWKNIVLAYEPVWAIGTGETATPDQAQEMHFFIRKTIDQRYGGQVADNVSVLYGGSVKPGNAKEIFSKSDVDGGLIGGASLKADDFMAIVQAFN